jgi:hypothetical protein
MAWLQLEQKGGRGTFPWAIEASRYTLAQLVLAHSRDYRRVDEIVQDVVDALEESIVEPSDRENSIDFNREETA